MATGKSIPQILESVRRGSGAGDIFTPQQVKPFLNKELQLLADEIKAFMIAGAELGGRQKFRKDGQGFVKTAQVTMTTDGGKITVPEYATYLDSGRKPGTYPPIAAIISWIKRYRILGRARVSGKYQKTSDKSINSAAYAIQRAIYKHGIKARPFINATLDFQDELISQVIDEIMIPQIVSILEVQFK